MAMDEQVLLACLRGNIFWEPLPNEDSNKGQPEELDPLLLQEHLFAAVEGVEELDSGKQVGENDVGRVYEECAHHTWP